jgi:hypothetical protein
MSGASRTGLAGSGGGRVSTVTGHGSDLDASGGEELPDLCGVLDDMAVTLTF